MGSCPRVPVITESYPSPFHPRGHLGLVVSGINGSRVDNIIFHRWIAPTMHSKCAMCSCFSDLVSYYVKEKNDAYTHTFPHFNFLMWGFILFVGGKRKKTYFFLLHTWRERQVALMLAVICQGQKPIVSASLLRSTSKHTCAPLRKAGKFNRMVDQSCVSFETDLAVGFVK